MRRDRRERVPTGQRRRRPQPVRATRVPNERREPLRERRHVARIAAGESQQRGNVRLNPVPARVRLAEFLNGVLNRPSNGQRLTLTFG